MCGIAGIVKKTGNQVSEQEITQMCDAIGRRGPDDWGFHIRENMGIGMRRLKVIDLESGHQPIYSEDGRYAIVFNGEVYNYVEIRNELRKLGCTFTSKSDTEVVLRAYEKHGNNALKYLRGMFAFCIWDFRENSFFIVRDRVGIKPLFYYANGHEFLFGSEMKAFLPFCNALTLNHEAISNYLTLSYIPAPLTIYREVRKLRPGHWLRWQNGRVTIQPYWKIDFSHPLIDSSELEIQEEYESILAESIRLRMRSDVPVGVFLSGGIDSGLLVAMMAEQTSYPVKTFTIGFARKHDEDERELARQIAGRYNAEHYEYEVEPNVVDLIPEIVSAFDEPFGDVSSIPTYIVSKMARQHVTVALSGLGGDELFAGYNRYLGLVLSQKARFIQPALAKGIHNFLTKYVPESSAGHNRVNHIKRFVRSLALRDDHRYLCMISLLTEDVLQQLLLNGTGQTNNIKQRFASYFIAAKTKAVLSKALYADIMLYLPDDILCNTDRLSMWHSLEVRVPFVDHHLLEYCATIPARFKIRNFTKKYLLRKTAARYLPTAVVNGKKKGFICPMATWLRYDLKEMCHDILQSKAIREQGIFCHRSLSLILDAHFSGRVINDTLIWSLLIFQSWKDNLSLATDAGCKNNDRSSTPIV